LSLLDEQYRAGSTPWLRCFRASQSVRPRDDLGLASRRL
jgi:hypothetical protein